MLGYFSLPPYRLSLRVWNDLSDNERKHHRRYRSRHGERQHELLIRADIVRKRSTENSGHGRTADPERAKETAVLCRIALQKQEKRLSKEEKEMKRKRDHAHALCCLAFLFPLSFCLCLLYSFSSVSDVSLSYCWCDDLIEHDREGESSTSSSTQDGRDEPKPNKRREEKRRSQRHRERENGVSYPVFFRRCARPSKNFIFSSLALADGGSSGFPRNKRTTRT
jgi:hypothetical protein